MHDVQPDRPGRPAQRRPALDGEPLEVPIERVVPRVSGLAFGAASGAPDGPGSLGSLDRPVLDALALDAPAYGDAFEDGEGAAFALPWASHPQPSKGVAILAIATAVAVGTWLVSGDARIGLMFMMVVGLGGYVRSVDRRVPFSFGEGFLGFRPDPV